MIFKTPINEFFIFCRCPECDYKTNKLLQFKEHVNSHTGWFESKLNIMEKIIKLAINYKPAVLKSHKKLFIICVLILGEKAYFCPVCHHQSNGTKNLGEYKIQILKILC